MGSKSLKKVASIALPIIGGAVGGPAGAAIGGAAAGGLSGKGLKGIALGGLKGYAGNVVGSALGSTLSKSVPGFGSSIGSISSKNAFGPYTSSSIGNVAGNSIGNTVANTTIGSAVGSYAGNALADNVAESIMPAEQEQAETPTVSPFSPSRQAQLEAPGSLSGFSSLTPDQASSNLATQGVYGGGLGPEEQGYFTNMINRKLIDDAGTVDSDLSDVSDIEKSYLAQLGLTGYGNNPRDLLEALSKWKAQ